MPELKPCPFCGEPPDIYTDLFDGNLYVSCTNEECLVGPQTGTFQTEEPAAEAWNRRTEAPHAE